MVSHLLQATWCPMCYKRHAKTVIMLFSKLPLVIVSFFMHCKRKWVNAHFKHKHHAHGVPCATNRHTLGVPCVTSDMAMVSHALPATCHKNDNICFSVLVIASCFMHFKRKWVNALFKHKIDHYVTLLFIKSKKLSFGCKNTSERL